MSLQAEIVVDGKNELGEGVVWSSAHGEVQWTDILGRRFWTYSPSDGATRSVALPDRLACFAPLGGTSLLAGFAGGLEVFDLKSGARRPIAAIEPDRPTTRVNDGKLDRRGRLVFGTMDEDPKRRPTDRPGLCLRRRNQSARARFRRAHRELDRLLARRPADVFRRYADEGHPLLRL